LIGQFVVVVWAAARPDPPAVIPAVVRRVHANLVLPADRTAARRIEAPLAEPFLVPVTESKRLIALHTNKNLIVHHLSPVRFFFIYQST
jgi:hypothetical protein